MSEELTQDLVRALFNYRDGNLYWKISKSYRIKIGNLAGRINKQGYRSVGINNKEYRYHRLIYLYHYGYLPKFIDHIDGNKLNNNIDNLRSAKVKIITEIEQNKNFINVKKFQVNIKV